jgi:CBS domain containing-hemolysin-like protein
MNEQSESGSSRPGFIDRLLRFVRLRNGGAAEELRETIEELIEHKDEPGAETDTDIKRDELVLLQNVLELRNRTAADVMVPRADIDAVEISTRLPDLIRRMNRTAHTRIPVYRNTLDHVVGMVHLKDVMACWDNPERVELATLVRRLLYVAPSMPVLELLLQMRASRIHMAVVVDEHGGTDGLITIEDVVEEIVGEIEDEHDDDASPTLIERTDGFIADARVRIEDFEDRVGRFVGEDEREDVDTLGGLVFYLAGRVPARGETITHGSGISFEVLDADPRRIKRLRITNLPKRVEEEDDG